MRTKRRTRPGPARTEMATIYDVARVAGVSTATVSRAIANPYVVAPATRDRVAAAVRELKYAPNPSARTHGAKSRMILALIPRLGSPFFTPFLDSVTDLLSESGYCVVTADLRGSPKKEGHYARLIDQGQFRRRDPVHRQDSARQNGRRRCPVSRSDRPRVQRDSRALTACRCSTSRIAMPPGRWSRT